MKAADIIARRFGVSTWARQNPLTSVVGTSVSRVLDNNPGRLAWTIVNLSPNNVYLALDRGVGATHGILLTPNGGSASMMLDEDYEATCWEMFGVASADNSDIFVIEVLIEKEVSVYR